MGSGVSVTENVKQIYDYFKDDESEDKSVVDIYSPVMGYLVKYQKKEATNQVVVGLQMLSEHGEILDNGVYSPLTSILERKEALIREKNPYDVTSMEKFQGQSNLHVICYYFHHEKLGCVTVKMYVTQVIDNRDDLKIGSGATATSLVAVQKYGTYCELILPYTHFHLEATILSLFDKNDSKTHRQIKRDTKLFSYKISK